MPWPTMNRRRGFTLIELSVVLAVIALLLLLVTPRYFGALDRSRDKVLAHNLLQVRAAIDQYHADRGRYPDSLDELVQLRYLRSVPVNPLTEGPDWVLLPPPPGELGVVYDIQAPEGAAGVRSGDGTEPGDGRSKD